MPWMIKVISFAVLHLSEFLFQGYPFCWGETANQHIDPPRITYQEFMASKANSGWLVREESEAYEEDEPTESLPAGTDTSYIQFRQIAVGETISCGITLIGSHLVCWGNARHFYNTDLPRQVRGPFRQVSVGSSGVCAIRGEKSEEENSEDRKENDDAENAADTLHCWGYAKHLINAKYFSAWDQVSVGCTTICGVSMDSEVECGSFHPMNDHRDIIIA